MVLLALAALLVLAQLVLILHRRRPDDDRFPEADPGPPLDPVLEPEVVAELERRRVTP